MAIEAHLAELEHGTRRWKSEINEALAHPAVDDLKIAELKRRKLQVKDEIARMRQERKRQRSLTGRPALVSGSSRTGSAGSLSFRLEQPGGCLFVEAAAFCRAQEKSAAHGAIDMSRDSRELQPPALGSPRRRVRRASPTTIRRAPITLVVPYPAGRRRRRHGARRRGKAVRSARPAGRGRQSRPAAAASSARARSPRLRPTATRCCSATPARSRSIRPSMPMPASTRARISRRSG